ncbi:MAG TPA: hypothetical protein VM491_09585, partial [Burkholderiaceae bacterium]|nr:hypothetical protein [Burkholderiaceae bacterium]
MLPDLVQGIDHHAFRRIRIAQPIQREQVDPPAQQRVKLPERGLVALAQAAQQLPREVLADFERFHLSRCFAAFGSIAAARARRRKRLKVCHSAWAPTPPRPRGRRSLVDISSSGFDNLATCRAMRRASFMLNRTVAMGSRIVALFAAAALAAAAVAAQPVPQNPILRVETGNHLSLITRVSTDAGGRWLVTASEDKTIRVWSARDGQPVAVLRPPVGEGSVGAVYAAAVSPDGVTIAAGGNSAFGGDAHSLYLFDRASGTLPKGATLTGLEAAIQQLAWSADGRLLAVGLGQQGLRVFDRELRYVGGDEEFNDAIYGLDFSRDGRLAAAGL